MNNSIDDYGSHASVAGVSTSGQSYSWLDESWRIVMRGAAESPPDRDLGPVDPHNLCSICTYAAECMYRGTAERPKQFCELFDVELKAFSAPEKGDPPADSDTNGAADLSGGLCANCEHRKDCTIRMTKGTVWHCEEYR